MSNSDILIFVFAVGNIVWNIKESKKRPIQSLFFGLLWVALATSIALGVRI